MVLANDVMSEYEIILKMPIRDYVLRVKSYTSKALRAKAAAKARDAKKPKKYRK